MTGFRSKESKDELALSPSEPLPKRSPPCTDRGPGAFSIECERAPSKREKARMAEKANGSKKFAKKIADVRGFQESRSGGNGAIGATSVLKVPRKGKAHGHTHSPLSTPTPLLRRPPLSLSSSPLSASSSAFTSPFVSTLLIVLVDHLLVETFTPFDVRSSVERPRRTVARSPPYFKIDRPPLL